MSDQIDRLAASPTLRSGHTLGLCLHRSDATVGVDRGVTDWPTIERRLQNGGWKTMTGDCSCLMLDARHGWSIGFAGQFPNGFHVVRPALEYIVEQHEAHVRAIAAQILAETGLDSAALR